MDKVFGTARPAGEYNFFVHRDDKGHLHVTVDTGTNGHTIVLSGFEITGFITEVAALQNPVDQPDVPNDGILPHEPSICGNAYLAAERALRVIENATKLGEAMTFDAIEQIHMLADEAGAAYNRLALRRDAFADDLPF